MARIYSCSVSTFVFSPPGHFGGFLHVPSFETPFNSTFLSTYVQRKYNIMQLFAYLVLAAKLAVFALATPITNTCTTKATSSPTARIAHNTSTTNATSSHTAPIPHNTSTTNATSSLPVPNANTTSSCSPDFLCGTQTGEGGHINHGIQVTFDSNE